MISETCKNFINNNIPKLKHDQRILGVAAGGSYITSEMDEYSDLDLVIAIDPEHYNSVMSERIQIINKLGTLLSAFTGEHVGEPRLIISLFGPELLHVDFKFISLNDIKNRVEDPIIIWERNKCLTKEFNESKAIFPIPDLQWMEDRFWIWVHYGATKIARGEIFETIEFISSLRILVIGPLLHIKNGYLPRGVRRLETEATESIKHLKLSIPTYSKDSCVKSLETIINMYLNLRAELKTENFRIKNEAQKYTLEFLEKVKHQITN